MSFTIKIAGVPIGIEHRYNYISSLCRDYICTDVPEFTVSVTEEKLEAESKLTDNRFPPAICESTCIHRELVRRLVKYGIMLMHSAVIAVDGEAYVFMAKSGVGKSTHIGLWREVFGERAVVVNGDKPMFAFTGERLTVYGSPWRGKEKLGENISMPVRAICFLERGQTNSIERASESEVIGRIFHQVLLPETPAELTLVMDFINRTLHEVPFYILKCNMDKEAALVSFEGMNKIGFSNRK